MVVIDSCDGWGNYQAETEVYWGNPGGWSVTVIRVKWGRVIGFGRALFLL